MKQEKEYKRIRKLEKVNDIWTKAKDMDSGQMKNQKARLFKVTDTTEDYYTEVQLKNLVNSLERKNAQLSQNIMTMSDMDLRKQLIYTYVMKQNNEMYVYEVVKKYWSDDTRICDKIINFLKQHLESETDQEKIDIINKALEPYTKEITDEDRKAISNSYKYFEKMFVDQNEKDKENLENNKKILKWEKEALEKDSSEMTEKEKIEL